MFDVAADGENAEKKQYIQAISHSCRCALAAGKSPAARDPPLALLEVMVRVSRLVRWP